MLIHTGQHYDFRMSDVFFQELDIPAPDVNLGIGSGTHGAQTGAMLVGIERILLAERLDLLVIYGDTNSTLAGALAAAKLHVPVAHVEAGLRSFNRRMPEEINRVVADHVATLLLCPTAQAVRNLSAEGITRGVYEVGDLMLEALQTKLRDGLPPVDVLESLSIAPGHYILATVHRAENTDDPRRLQAILSALSSLREPVLLPVHPRTRAIIQQGAFDIGGSLHLVEPFGFTDMLRAEQHARVIVTDSGGVQKEALWLGVPCVTLREETEWVETVESGWNTLVGANPIAIKHAVESARRPPPLSGAEPSRLPSERIRAVLEEWSTA